MTDRSRWIHKILEIAECMPHVCPDMQTASAYAEPGYSDPESGVIVFANWNKHGGYRLVDGQYPKPDKADMTMPRLQALLEHFGAEIEWVDEWHVCECGKAVRTSADSYSWRPSYWMGDGFIKCAECVQADPTAYLEWLEGNEDAAVTLDVDLSEHGYVKLGDAYATGWHPGQTDNPSKVAEALREIDCERFIFEITENQQFSTHWAVWLPLDELKRYKSYKGIEDIKRRAA